MKNQTPMTTTILNSVETISKAFSLFDSTIAGIQSQLLILPQVEVTNPRFSKSAIGLLKYAVSSYQHLKRGWESDDVSYLAWASRNLLELRVWSRFVLTSPEHSQQFYQEWVLDGIGKTKAIRDYGISINEAEEDVLNLELVIEKLEKLKAELKAQGSLSHNKPYYDLHLVASVVGIENEFKPAYKFLSGLVHPSPWLITGFQEVIERDTKSQDIFIASLGLNSYVETTTKILAHVKEHGVEADFPPRPHPWPGGPLG
jgi:hypothetical protein